MAFVINKKSTWYTGSRTLYYLVESYRIDKKVKRRTLLPLGTYKSVGEYLEAIEQDEAKLLQKLSQNKEKFDEFDKKSKMLSKWDLSHVIKHRLFENIESIKNELKKCQELKAKIEQFVVPTNVIS